MYAFFILYSNYIALRKSISYIKSQRSVVDLVFVKLWRLTARLKNVFVFIRSGIPLTGFKAVHVQNLLPRLFQA
jgi:hypothetical protein